MVPASRSEPGSVERSARFGHRDSFDIARSLPENLPKSELVAMCLILPSCYQRLSRSIFVPASQWCAAKLLLNRHGRNGKVNGYVSFSEFVGRCQLGE